MFTGTIYIVEVLSSNLGVEKQDYLKLGLL